ncbi:MAG TPA: hypothetical protein VFN29_12575 [Chiayiivirga sp.]|nr:hypothetical protein [Chiayiivirga sp.]
MRILPILASAVLALGLVAATPAGAHGPEARVWVSIGDVAFSAGRPFHRHHHHPLQVIHGSHGPRYYFVPSPGYSYYPVPRPVAVPMYSYPPRYYLPTPPPPRPGYYRHYRPGYYR